MQVGSRMFLFGGKGESGVMRDIHFLDLVEWTWVPVSATSAGPSPRMNMASLLVGRKIVVHGGWDGTKKCVNDLWVFDTDAFTWLNPRTAGLPPVARYGHALQLLEDGRILMFGGMSVNDGESTHTRNTKHEAANATTRAPHARHGSEHIASQTPRVVPPTF